MTGSTALNVVVAALIVAGLLATIASWALGGGRLNRRATTDHQQALDHLQMIRTAHPGGVLLPRMLRTWSAVT